MLVPDLYEAERIVRLTADMLWVVVASSLVFLMQAGFACLEFGLARAKNSINVAVKNLTVQALCTIAPYPLFQTTFCSKAVTTVPGAGRVPQGGKPRKIQGSNLPMAVLGGHPGVCPGRGFGPISGSHGLHQQYRRS